MTKKLIITIDGGGIRGIIPLVMLRHLQQHLPTPIPDLTTAWYGTSTGALIAAGLLIQQESDFSDAIQNVLDIYEFRSASSANPLGASNPARALHKIIDENFEEFSFERLPNLHVLTSKLPDYQATLFNLQNNVALTDALKATCAVPGLFDPIKIGTHFYADGFMAAKNPAAIALQHETPHHDLILLSLGTGILREVDATEIQVKATHQQCETASEKLGFHYFRFNPTLEEAADSMQDTRLKNIFGLKKDAEKYMQRKKSKFEELIGLLRS